MTTSTRRPIDTRARARARADAAALPGDVRVMNLLTVAFVAIGLALMASSAWAAIQRSPHFALRTIQVEGALVKTNVAAIRRYAAPKVAGNFFSLDLAQAREVFESVPWVRRASVRRVWPNALLVTVEEHRAAAFWDGGDGDDKLVNEYGEVFDANLGEVDDDALPILQGPDGSAARVLAMHEKLRAVLAPLGSPIDTLRLSRRGSWQVELDSGAVLELGRGSDEGDTADVLARTERFVRTLGEVGSRFGEPALQHADLRHVNGYAVRLQGVEVSASPIKPAAKR